MPHHETERALPTSATATKPNIECHNIARFLPALHLGAKKRDSQHS